MSSKYEFIDGEKADYPLQSMCRWLGVSRSGFYEWRGRPASATARRRFWLAVQVAKALHAGRGAYGYRRVWAALARRGVEVGEDLVRHLMAGLGLVACQPRSWRITTVAGPGAAPEDQLGGDFTACQGSLPVAARNASTCITIRTQSGRTSRHNLRGRRSRSTTVLARLGRCFTDRF